VAAAAVAVVQLRPHRAGHPAKPSTALRFDVDYVLAEDGSMQVVEKVVYDFKSPRGLLTRHYGWGIPDDMVPVDVEATRDGKPEKVAWSEELGNHRLDIGSSTLHLTGVHRYTLSYRIPDALGDERSELSRELISNGYAVRIEQSRLTVTLPTVATHVDCTVGLSEPCDMTGVGTRELVVTAGPMPRNTGVAFHAFFDRPLTG
jgi:hypothetical protein